jgi:tripartite motif-containing protein 71
MITIEFKNLILTEPIWENGGTFGSGNQQFDSPGDVIVDSTNKRVYVADIGNNRIEKFDLNGKFISMWGAAGRSSGQFDQPGDIAIDVQD